MTERTAYHVQCDFPCMFGYVRADGSVHSVKGNCRTLYFCLNYRTSAGNVWVDDAHKATEFDTLAEAERIAEMVNFAWADAGLSVCKPLIARPMSRLVEMLPGEADFQDSFNAMQSAIAKLPKTEVFDIALTSRPAAELCHEHGLPKGECECLSEFAAAAAELGGES